MRFIKKVLADCMSRSGVPSPIDEPEVPLSVRNPYKSTFLERVLLSYQSGPTGHPYSSVEKNSLFTPDLLQQIERERMMPEADKVKEIVRRDSRWVRR